MFDAVQFFKFNLTFIKNNNIVTNGKIDCDLRLIVNADFVLCIHLTKKKYEYPSINIGSFAKFLEISIELYRLFISN